MIKTFVRLAAVMTFATGCGGGAGSADTTDDVADAAPATPDAPAAPVCGDGIRAGTEQCDDGCLAGTPGVCEPVDDGDGCSAACLAIAPPIAGLVINEVDYDQYNTDAASFIELYNGTAAAVDLTGLALVVVNGATAAESSRYDLTSLGALPAAGFAVVGNDEVVTGLPEGLPSIAVGTGDFMQNNGPDGVLLIDGANQVIDALIYEGTLATATLDPAGAAVVVAIPDSGFDGADTNGTPEGEDFAALARTADGVDTDVGNADWALVMPGTPGAPNP